MNRIVIGHLHEENTLSYRIDSIDFKTGGRYGKTFIHRNADSTVTLQNIRKITAGKFKVDSTGDLTYHFIHAVGSADSIAYTPTVTKNIYTKINTGALVWHENDGLTCAGDSITIIKAGDYTFNCWLNATTSNATDQLRIKLYVNGAPSAISLGRWIINSNGAGVSETCSFMWYKVGMSAGDKVSVRITNLTASRNPTIYDFKLYVEKKPE